MQSMGFWKELWKLTRFEHAIMLSLAVFIAIVIVSGGLPPDCPCLILALLVPAFSEMGSFALNDYFDRKTDRLNKRMDRPLVKGTIKPEFAYWFSLFCLFASALMAYFINTYAFAIAVLFNVFAVWYNWKLKDMPLVGNVYIGTTMAIPFIFGNFAISSHLSMIALSLAFLGFVAGLAREIVKSVEDMEGDVKARKSRTLPVVIGERPALLIAAFLYLLFIPLTLMPAAYGLELGILPLLLVLAADAGILSIAVRLVAMKKHDKRKVLKAARKQSLAFLFLGLAGLLLASLL
ncbi:TPA: hypothetical protein EYP38_04925 [Candidatus Micrarchaeota archaeon]|nr:hypothetical protein [Candidatus Micrarchaeota archaeon]